MTNWSRRRLVESPVMGYSNFGVSVFVSLCLFLSLSLCLCLCLSLCLSLSLSHTLSLSLSSHLLSSPSTNLQIGKYIPSITDYLMMNRPWLCACIPCIYYRSTVQVHVVEDVPILCNRPWPAATISHPWMLLCVRLSVVHWPPWSSLCVVCCFGASPLCSYRIEIKKNPV